MDYLLTCESPAEICYVRYLQAYANGCHILNLPFVENLAKVDFECMIRKRFFTSLSEEDERAIDEVVLDAAYLPLMPAWFFERKPVTQAVRKRYQLKKPHGTQISIPAPSAKVDQTTTTTPSTPRFPVQRRRSCSKTAFSASYKYSTALCTSEEDRASYISKSLLLQIIFQFMKKPSRKP